MRCAVLKNMRLLPLLLWSSLALADSVNVTITNQVMKGRWPEVHVQILEPIAGFQLSLSRDGGKPEVWKGGGKPGVTRDLQLKHPEGVAKWSGELTVNQLNGQTGTMAMEFETEIVGPLKLTIDKDHDVDLEGRKVRFTLNQPAGKAHLKVVMDTGSVIVDDDLPFNGEPPGTKLEVSWPAASGRVLQIELRAYAKSGVFNGVEFMPWYFEVPHEEVNFASGSAEVPTTEAAKLDASVKLVRDEVEKVGRFAQLRLFVLGFTDTVGDAASNRALSLNRARAIAAYFRKQGVKVPILYEGFGEDGLLVGTADETDEARNRRAQYVLTVDDPAVGRVPFRPQWKKL